MNLTQTQRERNELFEAQAHIYSYLLNCATSMSLKCALELGIPDIVLNHKKPITIQELISKLNLPIEKTFHLRSLMRLLIHSKFFSIIKLDGQEGYVPTTASKLLIKNTSEDSQNVPNLFSFAKFCLDPAILTPWQFLGKWFNGSESTIFETVNGISVWEFANKNPKFNELFNDAMTSDSRMMSLVANDYHEIFAGVESVVDVGGGTGLNAKILLEAFPHMTCTVLDLPHVVADMTDTTNLKYVGGDMLSFIPSADVILFKTVLHNWGDEDVLRVLKLCRETIRSGGGKGINKGKVVIIDMVVDFEHDEEEITKTKMLFDVMMMFFINGKERTKAEWEKLFLEAGFSEYKITHNLGLRSLIEVFP
ncbi:hypothetical protein QVD17_19167 [Tagetes erecta]|uniref:Uncharacterized protein n=1 Tax=Tagetes erecta TaxID=13708 RepID=A0AAD8NWA6_TARER|nr:hypothetical protein QVD17_19167 [Tagetes erecta]